MNLITTVYVIGALFSMAACSLYLLLTWQENDEKYFCAYMAGMSLIALLWPFVLCVLLIRSAIVWMIEGIQFRRSR